MFACLRHSGYSWQIHRGEQVTGRIVGQGVLANLYFFASLSDHNHARLVRDVARGSWTRSLVQRQARNRGCLLLCRADQPGNLGGQLELKFLRPVRPSYNSASDVFAMKSQFPYPKDNMEYGNSAREDGDKNRQD